MTRLAVLADIHGNLPALEAVMADLAPFHVDRVIVAGDVINWGPFSAQVVERITREGWTVVRGNNELYLLDYQTPRARAEWSSVDQFPMLPWLRRQFDADSKAIVAGWRESVILEFSDAPALAVFHGSPRSLWEPIHSTTPRGEIENIFAGIDVPAVIVGHTHLQMDRQVGQWRLLNPGSVGVPLDGRFTAGYMLLQTVSGEWRATFRRVPFSYEPLYREFERQGFVQECGVVGRLVVQEFKTARIRLSPFLRWRQACYPGAPISQDLLERYAMIDPWDYTPEAFRVNVA